MVDVCEITDQKYLKGNTAVFAGLGYFKPISNETTQRIWLSHLKVDPAYQEVIAIMRNSSDIENGSIISLQFLDVNLQIDTDSFSTGVGAPRIITEKIFTEQTFGNRVWHNINGLIDEGREEAALIYLYETLNNELGNVSNCDSFLRISVGIDIRMSSDIIVHILNALYPIKSKLRHWSEFKNYAKQLLENKVGERTAKILLSACV